MSHPPQPPPAATTPLWATAVVIPTTWTPAQALAVFELLDELRDKVANLYAGQIQDILQEEQRHADAGTGGDSPNDNRSF